MGNCCNTYEKEVEIQIFNKPGKHRRTKTFDDRDTPDILASREQDIKIDLKL